MADEAKKKPDAAAPAADKKDAAAPAAHGAAPAAAGKAGKLALLKKTPVLIGGVMVLEAAVLAAGFKMLGGGPKPAAGADLVATEDHGTSGGHGEAHDDGHGGTKPAGNSKKGIELPVVEFRAPNNQNGRTFLYDVSIYTVTKPEKGDAVKAALEERSATIKHKVRTIIAEADPEKLSPASEPGLETLRRQVKFQLEQVLGEGLIEDVIIPRCIPFRTDY